LPQYGQLLINPDIEVIPTPRAFHQVFNQPHFRAKTLAHHGHFPGQLFGKLHFPQAVSISFKVAEHLAHKLGGFL
jgi:hypothetical protein